MRFKKFCTCQDNHLKEYIDKLKIYKENIMAI